MSAQRMIPIADIDAGNRLRVLDPAWVRTIADDMAFEGQEEPIRVVERGERFQLVAGARRLAAAGLLGWSEIEAKVKPAGALVDETSAQLAEIKADMMRGELTALDHAVYVATWCDLFRHSQAPRKRGPKPSFPKDDAELDDLSAKLALNWTEAAQAALGIARRGIFRSLKIAGIAHDLRDRIALHPVARKQSELLALAEQGPAVQASIVALLVADPARASSVTEAITLLNGTPALAKKAVYERTYETIATWKPAQRERLFDLLSDEFEEYLARRHGTGTAKAA